MSPPPKRRISLNSKRQTYRTHTFLPSLIFFCCNLALLVLSICPLAHYPLSNTLRTLELGGDGKGKSKCPWPNRPFPYRLLTSCSFNLLPSGHQLHTPQSYIYIYIYIYIHTLCSLPFNVSLKVNHFPPTAGPSCTLFLLHNYPRHLSIHPIHPFTHSSINLYLFASSTSFPSVVPYFALHSQRCRCPRRCRVCTLF